MADDVMTSAGNLTCSLLDMLENATYFCDADGDDIIDLKGPEANNKCHFMTFKNASMTECNASTFAAMGSNGYIYNYEIGCFYTNDSIVYVSGKVLGQQWQRLRSLSNVSYCPDVEGTSKMAFYFLNDQTLEDIKVSVKECVANCCDTEVRDKAVSIDKYVSAASRTLTIYNEKIKPYLNCESLLAITTRAKDFACVNVVNSVTPMYVGEILAAIASFGGTFVALLAVKRFFKPNRKKIALADSLKDGGVSLTTIG